MPIQLRRSMPRVEAVSTEFMGWKGVRNGELVRRARAEGFDVFLTADRALARSPRIWAPLGCVFVTTNNAVRILAAASQLETSCLTVVPGQVVVLRV